MKKLLKSLITLILLITLVSCAKEEETLNKQISGDFQYNINSTDDLLVISNYNHSKDKLTNYNFLLLNNNNLYIKNSYLVDLELGEQEISYILDNTEYNINLLITDNDKPYLVNYSNISYKEGENIELIFDMLDFEFHSIASNEMKDSDFNFSNNTVTIFKEYLDREFAKDRENLVLNMLYYKNNNYSNIFITIKK